jgi:poly(3-hydroxybutyrate) depolymerase
MRRAIGGLLAAVTVALGSLSTTNTLAAAAGSPQPRACLLVPGQRTETINFEGAPRSYRVAVPAGPSTGDGLPLILNFHGLGSNAVRQAVYSQLEAKGPERGYVVLTPEGTGGGRSVCLSRLRSGHQRRPLHRHERRAHLARQRRRAATG